MLGVPHEFKKRYKSILLAKIALEKQSKTIKYTYCFDEICLDTSQSTIMLVSYIYYGSVSSKFLITLLLKINVNFTLVNIFTHNNVRVILRTRVVQKLFF